MWQDRRALWRDNIIILYVPCEPREETESACESIVEEGEGSRKSSRGSTMSCGGLLFVCQTISGTIWLQRKQRAIIDRSFVRPSGKMRAPWWKPLSIEQSFGANWYRLFYNITNHRSMCWLIGNTCSVAIAENINTWVWRRYFKPGQWGRLSLNHHRETRRLLNHVARLTPIIPMRARNSISSRLFIFLALSLLPTMRQSL